MKKNILIFDGSQKELAEIIDLYGSISIKKSAGKVNNIQHWVEICVRTTDIDVLNKIKYYFGGTVTVCDKNRRRYEWKLLSRKAVNLLKLLQPFISNKQNQLLLALDFENYLLDNHKNKLTESVISSRDLFRERMSELNKVRE
jgi:hypothetical protein